MYGPLVADVYDVLVTEDALVHSIATRNIAGNLQELYFDVPLSNLFRHARTVYCPPRPLTRLTLTRVFINEDPGFIGEQACVAVSTIAHRQVYAAHVITLYEYGLGPNILDFGLVMHVACFQHDNVTVVYGPVEPRLLALLQQYQHAGLITNPDKTWLVVSPRYARAYAHPLQRHRRAGTEDAYFNAIPKRVLLDGPLVQYNNLKSEVKVYLNLSGHLAGLV
jgi:hypothetical protein